MLPSDEAERGRCRSAEQRARFSQITAIGPPEPLMPVGLLTLELHIPDAHSLKDKRQIVRSLKDRLRRHFNVAVAELEYQDVWQRAIIGVSTLATAEQHLEEPLQLALRRRDNS